VGFTEANCCEIPSYPQAPPKSVLGSGRFGHSKTAFGPHHLSVNRR
jgi:hypothetical protein